MNKALPKRSDITCFFSKRKKMSKNRGNANEKYLYHGTSPESIDSICAQNFDFRVSGKNATMFGKGSYFATTASYSHSDTSKDSNGHFSMFAAQVLVGKFTQVPTCLLHKKIIFLFSNKLNYKLVLNGNTSSKKILVKTGSKIVSNDTKTVIEINNGKVETTIKIRKYKFPNKNGSRTATIK